jgi:glycosyltransferase involved in cell wall biosynthesis
VGASSQKKINRLCVVQPIMTDYALPVFEDLAQYCKVDLIFSPPKRGTGFRDTFEVRKPSIRFFEVPTSRPFGEKIALFQWGVWKYIHREKPNAIIIFANPRYLSYWTTLVAGRLLKIPVYAHGHGIYKKSRITFLYYWAMKLAMGLLTGYICYAPIVRQSFLDAGFSESKLSVAPNTLINDFPVLPKQKSGKENGILFVGRLREGSNLELLMQVIERLRDRDGLPVELHVVGSGELSRQFKEDSANRAWVFSYGEVYDQARVRDISLNCFAGCYPGNAGLSVVHMMSLSLPVITHDDLRAHGPEPSFIENGVDGLLFDRDRGAESLYEAIKKMAVDQSKRSQMRVAAFAKYQRLSSPSLAARLWSIISGNASALGHLTQHLETSL